MTEKRIDNPAKFFDAAEKERILNAIRKAEKNTSGEIRLHLEKSVKKDPFEAAKKTFFKIGMDKTERRNGVLIFLVTKDRKFVILGDRGIDEVVPDDFWSEIVEEMQRHFKKGRFADGICQGIAQIGLKLKEYFPYQKDDVDELPDSISVNDKKD